MSPSCTKGVTPNGAISFRHDVAVMVWVAGVSGSGKSTVCQYLRERGHWSVDADWDGYSRWVHRVSGEPVTSPPALVPPNWLTSYAWRIDPAKVAELRDAAGDRQVFLFGTVENEDEVWRLFDLVACLVIDDDTLRQRLATRTTNPFGKHPAELEAALSWNRDAETRYRAFGARIINATDPVEAVADELLGWAAPSQGGSR